MLAEISRVLDDRSDKLGVLDSLLMDGRLAAKTIPTTMPVEAGYYSSNYGYRIDPITGRSSFHTGVDIIASPGTPVMAAAGGVVATVAYVSEDTTATVPSGLLSADSDRRDRILFCFHGFHFGSEVLVC